MASASGRCGRMKSQQPSTGRRPKAAIRASPMPPVSRWLGPEGFLIGELDGVPAATVSCVNYGANFAFLGFYIVREDLRGRGHGLRIWNAAIAHTGPRVIGLDGVVAQQQNYRKSGFELAYANVRYGGSVAAPGAPPRAGIVPLTEVPLAAVEAYDATVFPGPRTALLRSWIGSRGHVGCALVRNGGACRLGRDPSMQAGAARSDRWRLTTAPPPRLFCRPCSRAWAAVRSFSTFPPSTVTRSPWRKTSDSRQCSRPRACTPARSRGCGWSGYSASPPSSWGSARANRLTRSRLLMTESHRSQGSA